MKFLDLNGLKHLLEKLVSYNSSNGIAVKRIEGKPETGKNNSTLVLGSGIEYFNFYNSTTDIHAWAKEIRNNGKSSILIGKKDINNASFDDNDGISLISNDDISLYALGELKLRALSTIDINTRNSIDLAATEASIKMDAYDYIELTGNTQNSNTRSTIIVDDTIRMNTPRIDIHSTESSPGISFFRTTTSGKINIGGTVSDGAVSIEGGVNPYSIRFRLNSDVSARLSDNGTDKGFYIFTNLYANTDHSTDLPANITSTVKKALDTKSVQCLLAELLMNTGLY